MYTKMQTTVSLELVSGRFILLMLLNDQIAICFENCSDCCPTVIFLVSFLVSGNFMLTFWAVTSCANVNIKCSLLCTDYGKFSKHFIDIRKNFVHKAALQSIQNGHKFEGLCCKPTARSGS
jgi:hypothetical protein